MSKNQLVYEVNDLNLSNDELMLNETIFHNANGYIGIRSNFEEGYKEGYDSIRGSYINGFYDIVEMKQAEKLYGLVEEKQTMLNIVDTQTIKLIIDGETFSMFDGEILESKRWLDMKEGYTGRKIVWCSPNEKEVEIIIKRMTSFEQLALFTIDYTVTSLNFEGEIQFLSSHIGEVMNYCNPDDPRVAGESFKYIFAKNGKLEDETSYLTAETATSNLTVCTGVKHLLMKEGSIETKIDKCCAESTISMSIAKNESVRLVKYTVFSDSVRHEDCERQARMEMEQATSVPIEQKYVYQRDYLKKYWEKCILEIDGDDELSLAVNYNMYQLIQSVSKDAYSNIAAKGLSGEGYEGHYFWDTEMYIQPFFTLVEPEITKNLIEYRYRGLDAAREHAGILGHNKGALYPWRTIMGKECSGYFPSGSAQYHINGDIAYATIAYYLVTKDLEFISNKGAEIIFETARLWIEVGNYFDGQFRINEVTGPDEYTCMVNNNYFTNASAQYNLKWAVKFYALLKEQNLVSIIDKINLKESEVEAFKKAAECMYLPYDENLEINPQDDSFLTKAQWDIDKTPKDKFPLLLHYHPLYIYRHQVCKQADTVLAHFIYEDAQSLETIRKSYEYYEKVTTHDSSLSTCIFSIVASKLGMVDKAYGYFGDSAKLDLFNTHKNTKDGIHTANMGGNYMAIVYGFAGLRLKEEGLYFAPILPKEWKGYRFKISYEHSTIMVDVRENRCEFTLLSGSEKSIYVYGKKYELNETITIPNMNIKD